MLIRILFVMLALIAVAPSCMAAEAPQAAITRLTAEIKKQPSDMEARRNIAEAFLKTGLAVRAEEQMRIVMTYGKRTPEDFVLLGDTQRYAGKYTDAVRSYQEVLGANPSNAKAISGLAYCYMLSGDAGTANKICHSGLKQVNDPAGKKELADAIRVLEKNRIQTEQLKTLAATPAQS